MDFHERYGERRYEHAAKQLAFAQSFMRESLQEAIDAGFEVDEVAVTTRAPVEVIKALCAKWGIKRATE